MLRRPEYPRRSRHDDRNSTPAPAWTSAKVRPGCAATISSGLMPACSCKPAICCTLMRCPAMCGLPPQKPGATMICPRMPGPDWMSVPCCSMVPTIPYRPTWRNHCSRAVRPAEPRANPNDDLTCTRNKQKSVGEFPDCRPVSQETRLTLSLILSGCRYPSRQFWLFSDSANGVELKSRQFVVIAVISCGYARTPTFLEYLRRTIIRFQLREISAIFCKCFAAGKVRSRFHPLRASASKRTKKFRTPLGITVRLHCSQKTRPRPMTGRDLPDGCVGSRRDRDFRHQDEPQAQLPEATDSKILEPHIAFMDLRHLPYALHRQAGTVPAAFRHCCERLEISRHAMNSNGD